MSVVPESAQPGSGWIEIIRRKTPEAFAEAFTIDAVLDASVLKQRIEGAEKIRKVFAATSGMYESIAFTHETIDGRKTYLEWRGRTFNGLPVEGLTVLTRDPAGKIERVCLMHSPLQTVETFSAELMRRLDGNLR